MEWCNLPVELFGLITTYCNSNILLQLESTCKAWKENLREDWIWKDIATRGTSGFTLPDDISNWKAVALKRQFTLKNMREKRCISRSFASAEYTHIHTQINHFTSVAGDEALITWMNIRTSSYSTASFMGHEIINLTTGKRKPIQFTFDHGCVHMTKNFIVTSKTQSIDRTTECSKDLHIVDRRTKNFLKPYKLTIPEIIKQGTIYKNEDPTYKDGSMLAICIDDNKHCVVVDLEQRTTKKLLIPEEPTSYFGAISIRFYGKYLAAARMIKNMTDTRRLIVFDTENDEIIYDKIVHSNTWCISNDRLALVTCSKYGVKWMICDFKDSIISEFNSSDETYGQTYVAGSARLYGDILLVVAFSRAWFCDIKNSTILCNLHLIGWSEYSNAILHDMIGSGKFVISSMISSRIIDFESIAIIKEFKVQVILPQHDYGIIDDWKRPIAFHELMEFSMKVLDEESTKYASILISQDEDKNERTSLIFLAGKYYGTSASGAVNDKATQLIKTMGPPHRSVNMVMARFVFDECFVQSHIDFVKSTDTVHGRAVLYKEKFINGEWIPIDM